MIGECWGSANVHVWESATSLATRNRQHNGTILNSQLNVRTQLNVQDREAPPTTLDVSRDGYRMVTG